MTLLVIALIIAAAWIISLYYQLEQVKSHLRKLPEVAKEIDNNTDTLETEVFILKRALLNVISSMNETVNKMAKTKSKAELDSFRISYSATSIPAQAAFRYYQHISYSSNTTELLKKIYREHNLPEQYSSQWAMMEYNSQNGKQWSKEAGKANYEKYKKMIKRMLNTDFENMLDEIEAEEKRRNELEKKHNEYY